MRVCVGIEIPVLMALWRSFDMIFGTVVPYLLSHGGMDMSFDFGIMLGDGEFYMWHDFET